MSLPHDSLEHPWERRLHDELRSLPDVEAPASLVPHVMAAIRARETAVTTISWYRRPATDWPAAARVALGVAALALFGAIVLGVHMFWPESIVPADTGFIADASRTLGTIGSLLAALGNACVVVLRAASDSPWFLGAIGCVVFGYLALFGAGSALWRYSMRPSEVD